MGRFLAIICVALLGLAITLGVRWRNADRRLERLRSETNLPQDAPFEHAAIVLKAKADHVPAQKIVDLSLPVTVHLADRRCVELRPKWGVAGGIETYCFDVRTRRLIEHQQLGE